MSASAILSLGMSWFTEEPGGLNRMYAGLHAALAARDVTVNGLITGTPSLAGPVPRGISFVAPRNAPLLTRWSAFRRSVRAGLGDADVVAAHFAVYALPVLDQLKDRKFVVHFHGPWARESRQERESAVAVAAKRWVEGRVYRRADCCIVLSRAFAGVLARDYNVDPARIQVIPGGVDVARFEADVSRRDCRDRLGLPQDRPLIGTVRRLVHRVGLELLIDAMEAVRSRVPDALLLVAGSGPLAAALAARVAERGLGNHVRFLGYVADEKLPALYRACDLTVVPSVALEGFGLTTIESLASGTPVLVTPVGGLPETVEGLDPDLVLASESVDVIAGTIVKALRRPETLPSPSACREHARRNNDWSIIASRTLSVYES